MPEALERGLRAPRWPYSGLVRPLSTARVFRKIGAWGRLRSSAALVSTSPSSPSMTACSSRRISGTPSRDLRDTVAAETDEPPFTEAQVAELDRRLVDLERDPDAGESGSVVRVRIERRLHKAG